MTDAAHSDLIRDQFTRQATPFSTAAPIADAGALTMIVEAAEAGPDDSVLDVACGGGIVVCAFAPRVKHATGIDMTAAMLDRARHLAAEKGIEMARPVEHRRGHVDPRRVLDARGERANHDAAAAGDVEHRIIGAGLGGLYDHRQRARIGDRRGGAERRRLAGELVADQIAVRGVGHSLPPIIRASDCVAAALPAMRSMMLSGELLARS